MKKAKKLVAVMLLVTLCCSALSIGASAASFTCTTTATSFTGSSGTYYYVYYGSGSSRTSYYVGYNDSGTSYICSGKLVKLAQVRLVWGSWYSSNNTYASQVDGSYGSGTQAATKRYQGAYDLDVDGIIGANTWKAMLYYTYQLYPSSFPSLLQTNAYL